MKRALFVCLSFVCGLSLAPTPPRARAQTAQSAVEQLAAALAQAKDEGARQALLAAQPALATSQLVKALMDASDPLADSGQYHAAIALRDFTLALAERLNDRESAARLLRKIGGAYYRLNQYDNARAYGERTLKLATELQHTEIIGYAHHLFANIHNSREEFAQADAELRLALACYEQSELLTPQGQTWNDLANNYRSWGKFAQAEAAFERALALHQQTGNQRSFAITLLNQANLFYTRSDYLRARAQYQRAYELLTQLRLTHFALLALGNLGVVERLLGNTEEAEAALQRTLKTLAEIGDEQGQFPALTALGNLYFARGDDARAWAQYQRLRSLAEKLGNKLSVGIALMNTAGVYARNNQLALALDTNRQALPLFEQLNDKTQLAELWQKFGDLYDTNGQLTEARAAWQTALQYAEAAGDRKAQAGIYEALASSHRRQQQFAAAEQALQRATQLAQAASLRVNLLGLNAERATLQLARGEFAAALQTAAQLQTEAAALGHEDAFPEAYVVAGRAQLALKQPAQAERAFTQAIQLVEKLRTQTAGNESARQSFFSTRLAAHQALLPLLIQQQRHAEAFTLAERMKARVLLDVLQTAGARPAKTLTPVEQQRERELAETLASLNAQLRTELTAEKTDAQRAADLTMRRDQARLAREAFETQLYTAHPELRTQRGAAQLLTLTEANAVLPDTHTACLEFAATDDQTFLFVLTRGVQAAALNVYPLNLTRAELTRRTESFRQLLAARDPAYKPAARALYDALLAPARAALLGKTRLLIVPDGALWELPFQALVNETGRHLLESCTIAYAPSLTVLREMQAPHRAPAATTGLLAFGNPQFGSRQNEPRQLALRADPRTPLPEAEREVKALAQLYGSAHSRVYIAAAASETRLKAEAAQARVLHFATHGVLNDAAPLYSHLVLAADETGEDGLLEAWELMRLDLHAELAVLSACETARGRVGAGEGLIGLTWALFVAGCPATVASQWKVEAASTAQLMIEFHRRLNAAPHVAKAEALRAAALKLLASETYRHPFYWAGFVLLGDGL
ncbi:MAG: CHAT domain-containing protein [Acidobacteria bacterium]|nr:CHAT domain-containing protein [Acidobacteriota bacterium]MBI3422025.1 CHAT domain-containing protein [Acidobacteriota bacterium]